MLNTSVLVLYSLVKCLQLQLEVKGAHYARALARKQTS